MADSISSLGRLQSKPHPRFVPRWAHALFLRIAEPRVQRLIALAAYLASIIGGLSVVLSPPRTIEGVIGASLALIWGLFLVLGGALGASVVLRGVWWVERAAVIACGTGLSIYLLVVSYLVFTESGSRLMQAVAIVLAILNFVKRWTEIRKYAYDPES